MRFFIYSRKSVDTGKGESIGNQIEMCRQYIAEKFPDTAGHAIAVYEDEGFSAKNTDRPRFQQMLADIREQKPDFVVCYRLDRISRSVSDFSALIEELNDKSIAFICIKEEFDTSKPMGKAMMYIASVFAQLERETIAERVRDNMLLLARTGRWLGGTTPTGYTSEKEQEIILDGKIKTSCKLKENPEELRAVDAMFERFLEVRSVSGVSKYLMKKGFRSRNGKYYTPLGVKDILQNPVYCMADREAFAYFTAQNSDVCFDEGACSGKYGLLAYNKRDYRKKHAPRQTMDKWIVAIGRHKGRVPGRVWAAVQGMLAANRPAGTGPARVHNEYALLSGLIWCGSCGERMFAKRRSGRNANAEVYDYVCSSKLRGGKALCGSQNLNGPEVDTQVCRYLTRHIRESTEIFPMLERLKREIREGAQEDPLTAIELRVKKCGDELDNLVQTLGQGALAPVLRQRVNARAAELEAELRELAAQRACLEQSAGLEANKELQVHVLAAALSSLDNGFDTLTIQEKRTLLRLLVQKILWDGEDLHIFMDGQ